MAERDGAEKRLSLLVETLVFSSATATLTRCGISAIEADRYSAALARENVPDGYESFRAFDINMLTRVINSGASKAMKKSAIKTLKDLTEKGP